MEEFENQESDRVRPIRVRGQTISDAYQEWVKENIKSSAKQVYDLGKFFFGVSIGSIGLVTGIERFVSSAPNIFYFVSMGIFLCGAIVSMFVVVPKKIDARHEVDLVQEYYKFTSKYSFLLWIWFFIWLLGICFGVLGLFF